MGLGTSNDAKKEGTIIDISLDVIETVTWQHQQGYWANKRNIGDSWPLVGDRFGRIGFMVRESAKRLAREGFPLAHQALIVIMTTCPV